MTTEEAIKMLKSKLDGHTDTSWEWAETVRMAIGALEVVDNDCSNCIWYQLAQKNLDESEEEE